jgi:twitching motility protein PilT
MELSNELISLFDAALAKGASDIHLLAGASPRMRIYGELVAVSEVTPLTQEGLESLLLPLFSSSMKNGLQQGTTSSAETLVTHGDFNFVINVFRSGGAFTATIRILSAHVPTVTQVGYAYVDVFKELAKTASGLILITGPVGCGKQTTAFALIQEINATRPARIHLLVESLSYRLQSAQGLVSSVIIGQDVPDYDAAIRMLVWHADPDVIYLADLPDMATVQSALTAARAGHLVIANATAPSAAQALATIYNALPENLLQTLSEQLVAVTNQRLFRKSEGPGRVPAYEIVRNSRALREAMASRADVETLLQTLSTDQEETRYLPESIDDLTRAGAISASAGEEALRDYLRF